MKTAKTLPTALIQERNHGDAEANLAVIEQRVGEAARSGAKLVLVPGEQGKITPDALTQALLPALRDWVVTRGRLQLTEWKAGVGYTTVELKVNYVGKIDASVKRLLCTGTVIHAGRTMLTADAKLTDESGKLYAHGSGTFLVYPK